MARALDFLASAARRLTPGQRRKARSAEQRQAFRFEPLEPRIALSAAGLVPVGSQPAGPLSGKIVYASGGHGWEWNSNLNRWDPGRVETQEMVEAFGNQDQLTFYADYLLRAGATVVPMRPVGRQLNEVVLDNDSPGVSFSGSWSNSAGTRYYDEDYGAVADAVSYRFANTSAAETAVASYTPAIPQAGFYPIYTWVAHGSNRTSQLYKINHTGGQTQIRVDHSKVGNGWVYLGTYYFAAGSSAAAGSVQISNEGAAGKVVIADAIRFGNGMGDVKDGNGGVGAASGKISGYPREDEAALMWLWRAVGQGVASPSAIIGTNNVNAPGYMAEHMNVDSNAFGTSVYVGFHSNAVAGAGARGTVGLVHSSSPTPNQAAWAGYLANQIEEDIQLRNGDFEFDWASRNDTLAGGYGEINTSVFGGEMDATIIEVAFHDNAQDGPLLRDPKIREQIGRSSYEATLQYFDNFGGLNVPVVVASKPVNVSAASNASGEATIRWAAGPTGVYGAAATGYRIYASTDGYGFDGGTFVAGGGTTSATLSGYDPTIPYYFKVVAVNAGGESLASEVVAVLPSGGQKQVLIVNGFDRFDRTQNVRYPYAFGTDGLIDRVWARYNNSFDYVVQVAAAIHASANGVHFASASNEAVINGAINLVDYDAVVWVLGNESTANDTFNATEQTKVESFIAAGGHLFVTGSEIAFDLDQSNNGRTFFETTLQGNYVADDANTYNVTAAAGGIFSGISFSFDNGAQFYNVSAPDVIAPQAGAIQALTYSGVPGGSAGIQVTGTAGRGNVVVFGFPFETITTAANRAAVMDRVLDFFGVAPIVPTGDFDADGVVDGADFLAWQRGFGAVSPALADGDADRNGVVDGVDLAVWSSQFGSSESAAAMNSASIAALEAAEESTLAAVPADDLGWLAQRRAAMEPAVAPSRFTALLKQARSHRGGAPSSIATDQRVMSERRGAMTLVKNSSDQAEVESLDLAFEEQSLGGDDWQSLR